MNIVNAKVLELLDAPTDAVSVIDLSGVEIWLVQMYFYTEFYEENFAFIYRTTQQIDSTRSILLHL